MKEVHQHFSKIVHEYEDLRTTDTEPIGKRGKDVRAERA